VDLLPAKICTLDCIYCECGKTKTLTTDRKEYVPAGKVESEIRDYLSGNPDLDYITFSGSGEPTLHSCIGELIKFLKYDYPRYRIALLTNGTLLHEPAVFKHLLDADLVKVSLDAGSVESFVRVNRPHNALELSTMTEGLINFRNIYSKELWVEVFLVKGVNDHDTELKEIKKLLELIRPDRVHVNTLDRPGTEIWVEAVEKSAMENIAGYLNDARLIDRQDSTGGTFSSDMIEPKQRAHSQPKFPPAARPPIFMADMAGGLAAGLASGLKTDTIHCGRRLLAACGGELQFITATVKRRPCTAGDVSRILNITDYEAKKYLDILSERGKIGKRIMPSGVFYFRME
jgi:wyosine [tRNA(Phe)-imidazoG37] synthetase (radical SAM superfamily)